MTKPNVTRDNYFDAAKGLYWFCTHWHGGQNSALYSILSTMGYKPAFSETGPSDEDESNTFYDYLESKVNDCISYRDSDSVAFHSLAYISAAEELYEDILSVQSRD